MYKSVTPLTQNFPLVEAVHHGNRQRPSAVLLRTSWTTDDSGAANGIAQAWHNPYNHIESCHYVVDSSRVIRCLPDKVEAFPTKQLLYKGSVSIDVCYNPPSSPQMLTVGRAAELTAHLCKHYHIPVRLLDLDAQVRWMSRKWRSRGGIILNTVGNFPTDKFLTFVEDEYKGL